MGVALMTAVAPAIARPFVVELIGPAGAGKSAVLRALRRHSHVRTDLSLWGLPFPLALASAARLLPPLAAGAVRGRPVHPAAAAQMARVDALGRMVELARRPGPLAVVLDEGPVFALAWLQVFFTLDRNPTFAVWRRAACAAWATRLDAVILLDAPDATLARRIRGRTKAHMVKASSDAEIGDFSARFRSAFQDVLAALGAAGGVTVDAWSTEVDAPSILANRVLALAAEHRDER